MSKFYRGACTRGIYDNMKTAVETVFVGKDRQFNRRFVQMWGHYLAEPTACTPASRWKKGQVEIQAYAERIVIRQDGAIVGEHGRCFGRNQTIYDPWHYVPVLARSPARCVTVRLSKISYCRPIWSMRGAGWRARMTAIARWSKSYRRC
jgi:hypothetical protein